MIESVPSGKCGPCCSHEPRGTATTVKSRAVMSVDATDASACFSATRSDYEARDRNFLPAKRTNSISTVAEIAVVKATPKASVWLSSKVLPPMKPSRDAYKAQMHAAAAAHCINHLRS